jgi:peptide-methionine (S)-S-oxide reductase
MAIDKVTMGCGCFWCSETVFQQLKGVETVTPGYSGGATSQPGYEQVCSGNTGHAEVLQIRFDSDVISFRTLLQVFFNIHDPTTLNRQCADVGTQYRSVIFYHNDEQKIEAGKVITEIEALEQKGYSIVTEVKPLDIFYEAEKYHHNYYNMHSSQAYCQTVISPKLSKLQKRFSSLLRNETQ